MAGLCSGETVDLTAHPLPRTLPIHHPPLSSSSLGTSFLTFILIKSTEYRVQNANTNLYFFLKEKSMDGIVV